MEIFSLFCFVLFDHLSWASFWQKDRFCLFEFTLKLFHIWSIHSLKAVSLHPFYYWIFWIFFYCVFSREIAFFHFLFSYCWLCIVIIFIFKIGIVKILCCGSWLHQVYLSLFCLLHFKNNGINFDLNFSTLFILHFQGFIFVTRSDDMFHDNSNDKKNDTDFPH